MSDLTLDTQIQSALLQSWERVTAGGIELCMLQGDMGSGARKLVRGFQNKIGDRCLTWHLRCLPVAFRGWAPALSC